MYPLCPDPPTSAAPLLFQPSWGDLASQPWWGDLGLQPWWGDLALQPWWGDLGLQPWWGDLGLQPWSGDLASQPCRRIWMKFEPSNPDPRSLDFPPNSCLTFCSRSPGECKKKLPFQFRGFALIPDPPASAADEPLCPDPPTSAEAK